MGAHERSDYPMKDIEYPLANDVVYGRGGLANNHKGNKRFRSIVNTFKAQYAVSSRHEKTAMAESLVKKWRDQTPPGRFLKLNPATDLWDDVGKKARGKCSQLLREKEDSKDEDDFDEVANAALAGSEQVEDIQPLPPAPMEDEDKYSSPLQNRTTREIQPVSPDSVMDMPFFCVESVAKAASARQDEAQAAFSSMLQGFKTPALPPRQKLKRRKSSSSSASDIKPAAKRPSVADTPQGSFFRNLIPKNIKVVTIEQDNAAGSPTRGKPAAVVKKETVAHIECPMEVETNAPACNTDAILLEADKAASNQREACAVGCDIPRPAKVSYSKRERSIDIFTMEISVDNKKSGGLGDSEHSFSLKSLEMEFDDDPILKKCLELYESSEHSGTASRKSTATFSLNSSSSTMDHIMEDMTGQRNTSSDTAISGHSVSAIQCWEAAYGTGDNESQPDLDDFSLMSTESFLDDPSFDDEPYARAVDELSHEGLDSGSSHTAKSVDSETLHQLVQGTAQATLA
ncbi:expressed unknown protein [Seminavis robusta]|uniref:DUF6824 domain-containing protein n=1 Tax=Seminavis robusta TaxID=568900 RepID=A0A9N8E2M2_9STRA|nr:expressed unknown protein [Seminavis robusta]|eukprot:Sro591_g172080.1 n/a (515) ;mRNA; f:46048-48233